MNSSKYKVLSWVVFTLTYFLLCIGLSIPSVMFTGGITQIVLINLFGILPLIVAAPVLLKMQGFRIDKISKLGVVNINLIILVGVTLGTACDYFTKIGSISSVALVILI